LFHVRNIKRAVFASKTISVCVLSAKYVLRIGGYFAGGSMLANPNVLNQMSP
jgi:hypothetical protein